MKVFIKPSVEFPMGDEQSLELEFLEATAVLRDGIARVVSLVLPKSEEEKIMKFTWQVTPHKGNWLLSFDEMYAVMGIEAVSFSPE